MINELHVALYNALSEKIITGYSIKEYEVNKELSGSRIFFEIFKHKKTILKGFIRQDNTYILFKTNSLSEEEKETVICTLEKELALLPFIFQFWEV